MAASTEENASYPRGSTGVTVWTTKETASQRPEEAKMRGAIRRWGPAARRLGHERPTDRRLPEALHPPREIDELPARGELAREPALARLEAALLIADEPLSARRLAQIAGLPAATEARRLLRRLESLYAQDGSAFQVEELAGGFQLLTRPEFQPWLVRLRRANAEHRLTPAARETLAIVAYRQPIIRADIEKIRGVQCGDLLRLLMEKGLVKIVGRHDSLGRPVLYGTTKKFLQAFGLKSLRDLPDVESLRAP
jgi:segregation and condensation protein B